MRENHKFELQRKIITLRNATQVGVKIRLEIKINVIFKLFVACPQK